MKACAMLAMFLPLCASGMFVPADDPRLSYSDCFKVDFVGKAARFSRPGQSAQGYQHDNPGARLRFRSDAPALAVKLRYNELHVSTSARNPVGLRLVDGRPAGAFATKQKGVRRAVESVDVDFQSPGKGFHDYEVVMPYGDSVDVLGVSVPEGAKFEPPAPRPARRCAFYGDSVTHGFTASSIATTYPFLVSRLSGLQMVNLGIGGRGSSAQDGASLASANCDLAVVHIGVNDWQGGIPPGATKRNMAGFLKAFRERQPATPLLVVTPLWVADTWIRAPKYPLADYREALREAVEASGDRNAKVIDGLELIDHDAKLFDPVQVHPNDAGFAQMAERLAKAASPGDAGK